MEQRLLDIAEKLESLSMDLNLRTLSDMAEELRDIAGLTCDG